MISRPKPIQLHAVAGSQTALSATGLAHSLPRSDAFVEGEFLEKGRTELPDSLVTSSSGRGLGGLCRAEDSLLCAGRHGNRITKNSSWICSADRI